MESTPKIELVRVGLQSKLVAMCYQNEATVVLRAFELLARLSVTGLCASLWLAVLIILSIRIFYCGDFVSRIVTCMYYPELDRNR